MELLERRWVGRIIAMPTYRLNILSKPIWDINFLAIPKCFRFPFTIWGFPKIGVPLNHPILVGFSLINRPCLGTPLGLPPFWPVQSQGFPRFSARRMKTWTASVPSGRRPHRLEATRISGWRETAMAVENEPWNISFPYSPCVVYLHIFTYIWVIYGGNVGKYSIHEAYGIYRVI